MITIHADRCTGCGLCVETCHESCLNLTDSLLQINRQMCDICTQCIAICPRQALSWDGVQPTAFDRSGLPSSDQIMELFKERRSIRAFKETPIERALLEEIAACGVYAPTHNHVFKIIIVDDPDLVAQFSAAILRVNNRIYRWIYQNPLINNRLVLGVADLLGFGDGFRKARPKLEKAQKRGAVFSSTPVAMMIIVGTRNMALAEASAQYALANMMFYAQIKGVGTCLWGNAQLFLDKDKATRQRLGLPKPAQIYGAFFMGYPKVKFSNKVNGKALPIQWNNSERNTPAEA